MYLLYFGLASVAYLGLEIAKDWLLYKGRGKAQQNNPNDPPITGPEDASAQRLIDLYKKKR